MESYYDISNDLNDVWEADIDPVSWPCYHILSRKGNLNYLFRAKIHQCTRDVSRFRASRTNRIPIKLIINNYCSDRPCFVIKVPASVKKIIGVRLTIPEYHNEVIAFLHIGSQFINSNIFVITLAPIDRLWYVLLVVQNDIIIRILLKNII